MHDVETRQRGPVFVVGCPRSGTTLLRVMLDTHPNLAVTHETHFIVGLAPRRLPWLRAAPATVEDVIGHERVVRLSATADELRGAVEAARPSTYGELIDVVMRTHAGKRGKQRWGDKTPGYLGYMPMLLRQLPDARFVHIIRDGRHAAASLAERQQWGPRSAISGAFWWARKVREGRRAGARLGDRYLEVHLEDLIADTERVLRTICAFLGEPFAPEMLRYHERTDLPKAGAHVHLKKPPTEGLRDWRVGLSERDQRAIESICRRQLRAAGYRADTLSVPALVWGWSVAARDLLSQGVPALRARLAPRSRSY